MSARSPISAHLVPHPATPCDALDAITVDLALDGHGGIRFAYRLRGDIGRLLWPDAAIPARADDLWQHACCEAFVGEPGRPGYLEFNFSPSGCWAAYAFADTRRRAADPVIDAPAIAVSRTARDFDLMTGIPAAALPRLARIEVGLAVVIEAKDGILSYWALRHPAPVPDFHRREAFTFILDLPA